MQYHEDQPYLILHKVRGEPQFDVAEPMNVGEDLYWIIPTSGHRAYPFIIWPLFDTTPVDLQKSFQHAKFLPNWNELPDHYVAAAQARAQSKSQFGVDDL